MLYYITGETVVEVVFKLTSNSLKHSIFFNTSDNALKGNVFHVQEVVGLSLSLVCTCRDITTMTSPVSMNELTRTCQQFISVSSKVVTLGLDEIGR